MTSDPYGPPCPVPNCGLEQGHNGAHQDSGEPNPKVTIVWVAEDVMDHNENMTLAQANQWLRENGKYLKDRSIELGHEVISDLLEMNR